MPVFALNEELRFPPPELAEPEGLLALGGDLDPSRLLLAYSSGLFPWFGPGDPILWWSPDPRCILQPTSLHVSRSLARTLRRGSYRVSIDRNFDGVIEACAAVRREREGTWLVPEMIAAYRRLHRLGYAHSVEVWLEEDLVGGVYGVSLGRCFFGESMFHVRPDASKVALVALAEHLRERGVELVDCQQASQHLLGMGATQIPRREFLRRLREAGVSPETAPAHGHF